MERVFLVLERIWRLAGDGLKEEMLELRLLLQVKGDLDEMYNEINYDTAGLPIVEPPTNN